MPPRIESDFAKDKRERSGDVMEPREIARELLPVFKEKIEAAEIRPPWREIFGGGKIRVSRQTVRGNLFHNIDQLIDKSLNTPPAVIANDIARNFIGHADRESGRMIACQPRRLGHSPPRILHRRLILKKAAMLVPGNIDEHPQL